MTTDTVIYHLFHDGDTAYSAWLHEAKTTRGYPPFHRWIYMTVRELYDCLDPVSDYSDTYCAFCANEECQYRTNTCWKCVTPDRFVHTRMDVRELREKRAVEYVSRHLLGGGEETS